MNRRTSIKGLIVLVSAITASFSLYKWIIYRSVPDISMLYGKKKLIAELAETIIPRTDTPGAKDAKVEDFIINIIEHCSDIRTMNSFMAGLNDLEEFTDEKYNRNFIVCSPAEQMIVVKHFESRDTYSSRFLEKIKNKLLGESFFSILKELTIEGYCTSLAGATEGLAYDYVPGGFHACIPLIKNQKSWATK